MASKKRKQKIRTEFRKRYDNRTRQNDLTREYGDEADKVDDAVQSERVSGRGKLGKKRTIVGSTSEDQAGGFSVQLDVDESECLIGRVLKVHGLASTVRTADGTQFQCATRGLLKSLATDLQNVVVTGDMVTFRPLDDEQGVILRIEPRHGIISRTSRKRQQILVSNVDQVVILTSAAEPTLKPNLIDRFIISSEATGLRPIICINKVDLVDPAELQPIIGVWGQMGYQVVLMSVTNHWGVDRLRELLINTDSVVTGQSGVGKSSLLNAIEPGLGLRIGRVSDESQKGRHTTTYSQLIPLTGGGHIVDTPGIRQFELWDVIPAEVEGYFRDIRPYVSYCRYPNCTHTHELECAVEDAVADYKIDLRRYDSYCQIFGGQ